MTEEKVNELFGPLKIGIYLKLGVLIGGCILGGLLSIAAGYLFYKYKKNEKLESHL